MKAKFYLILPMIFFLFTGNLLAGDSIPPHIYLNAGKRQNVQIASVWQLNEPRAVSDDQTDSADIAVELSWGIMGPVNVYQRGEYRLFILATDLSGNYRYDTVTYSVDDFIPPVIDLNTPDQICVQQYSVYNRVEPSATDNYYSSVLLELYASDVDVNVKGLYMDYYKATDGSGNVAYKNRIVEVNDCSTSELITPDRRPLRYFPNPASEMITLSSVEYNSSTIVCLYDPDGKKLLQQPLSENREIDVSALEAGMYFISVFDGVRLHTGTIQILR